MNQTQIQYLMNLPYTDPGNAERLHVMIGSDWKFVPQINRWVHWNGKRWQEETNAVLRNVAVASYRKLASAIRSLPQTLDQTEQKRRANVLDWLRKSESLHHFKDAMNYWQGCNAADFAAFDANPFLLNVQNGTLNLATGTLQPFDKKDLLTKICAAGFEETVATQKPLSCASAKEMPAKKDATAGNVSASHNENNGKSATPLAQNLWLQTVNTILPDPAVRRWMQKFMGYCLTGSTEEEKFVIAYGPGGSGKGTFFETIAAAISDYKATLSIDTLLATAYVTDGQRPTPEFAKLPGKRYVLSSESNPNRRLDEAKVKLLTGGVLSFLQADFADQPPARDIRCHGQRHPPPSGDCSFYSTNRKPGYQVKTETAAAGKPERLPGLVRGRGKTLVCGRIGQRCAGRSSQSRFRVL